MSSYRGFLLIETVVCFTSAFLSFVSPQWLGLSAIKQYVPPTVSPVNTSSAPLLRNAFIAFVFISKENELLIN